MQFANPDRVCAARGRPSDETLEMKQSMHEVRHSVEELRDASQATKAGAHLLRVVEKHQPVVDSRIRRFDRTEITVEAILEGLGRHREQRPPQ